MTFSVSAQDCFVKLASAFNQRGSYTVADDMHRNVIISYFEKDGTTCVSGKARVENGVITSIFIQYVDHTYALLDEKFFNEKKTAPSIINGISEMIYTSEGHKLKVVFIDKLKPKEKEMYEVVLPDELTPETNSTVIDVPIENDEWLGNGSGFFLDKRGYIATNHHVVDGAKVIQVEFYQKGIRKEYLANVIASDKINDLAILKIQDTTFNLLGEIPYVFSTSVKDVGLEVFTLGYPISDVMGEEIKFTDGNISSKTGIQGDVTNYQISVPIQPGNSGGPLFDIKGNLIGITSSYLNRDLFDSENVNYAIKSTYLKNLIDVLPQKLVLPNYIAIYNLTLIEKLKKISDYIPIIRVK